MTAVHSALGWVFSSNKPSIADCYEKLSSMQFLLQLYGRSCFSVVFSLEEFIHEKVVAPDCQPQTAAVGCLSP